MSFPVQKTDEEWRKILTPAEFKCLRQDGTERPGSHDFCRKFPRSGHFVCAGCSFPLFSCEAKFQDDGWPAWDACFWTGDNCHVGTKKAGTCYEVHCNACGGHLGHVFHGEGHTKNNERN
jgi:peptide-methionine (R)-S-oxide reductase